MSGDPRRLALERGPCNCAEHQARRAASDDLRQKLKALLYCTCYPDDGDQHDLYCNLISIGRLVDPEVERKAAQSEAQLREVFSR